MVLKKIFRKEYILCLFSFQSVAQNTTGDIGGSVKTLTGEILAGATIKLVHEPTGMLLYSQSRGTGIYRITGLAPGGPYTLEVSFVNFLTQKKSGVYIPLGEEKIIDFQLALKSVSLENVQVIASRKRNEPGWGETGILTEEKIAITPSVGRNLQDYIRNFPQAKLVSGNEGAVSIAGQNNRFNAFYIDGAISNDVFGLAASGTNGGQAGISPVSMEAIHQLQMTTNPFDASLGNFTGAGINAVTRSGTNRQISSFYHFFSNAMLTGKTPTGPKQSAINAEGFRMQQFGASLQGPITTNKVFYFLNFELQRDIRPQPFSFSDYKGNTQTIQLLNILSNTLKGTYHYEAGGFLHNPETLHADRLTARFDWAINSNHKISFSTRYLQAQKENTNANNSSLIHFRNDGYLLNTHTYSFSMELKSNFLRTQANQLMLTYTRVEDDRDPLGKPFPRVRINDGNGAFIFGTDNSSTLNLLIQQNWSLFEKYSFTIRKHAINLGMDFEFSKVVNAFIQNSFGNYTYYSIADFLTNAKPSYYQLGFSLRDNQNNDHTKAAANFATLKSAIFVNDKIRVTSNFYVQYGVRIDHYRFINSPIANDYINQIAIPQYEKYWDLQNARSDVTLTVPVSISPRLGFRYGFLRNRVQLSGGMGLFTGRIPLAWPGGAYQNNGLFIGGFTAASAQLNAIRFRPNPYQQWTPAELGVSANSTTLNLIAKQFNMPQVLRASFGLELILANNWTVKTEMMLSQNTNGIKYTNVNILPPTANATGPDNRSVYTTLNNGKIPLESNGSNPYNYTILLGNYKGNNGFAKDFTATISKKNNMGLLMEGAYHFSHSVTLHDGTSSVNQSQWRFMETVHGRNYISLSTSDFSAGHKIMLVLSKRFQSLKRKYQTTISFSYTGESGSGLSYVYSNGSMTRDDGINGGNDLIFIPTPKDLDGMIFLPYTTGMQVVTAQQQKDAFEKYISQDKYLSQQRGKYAQRNGSRTPFTHIVDLKIKEELNFMISGKKYQVQLSLDVFNISNLINRNWGRRYYQPNDNFAPLSFMGYLSETQLIPQYRFDPNQLQSSPWLVSNSLSPSFTARWMAQMGIRFTIY